MFSQNKLKELIFLQPIDGEEMESNLKRTKLTCENDYFDIDFIESLDSDETSCCSITAENEKTIQISKHLKDDYAQRIHLQKRRELQTLSILIKKNQIGCFSEPSNKLNSSSKLLGSVGIFNLRSSSFSSSDVAHCTNE